MDSQPKPVNWLRPSFRSPSLAGEFLQVVAKHTLLAASLPGELPDQVDRDAAEAGAVPSCATAWGTPHGA